MGMDCIIFVANLHIFVREQEIQDKIDNEKSMLNWAINKYGL